MPSNDDLALTSPCPGTSHSAASDTVADGEPEDQHIAITARERAVRVIDSDHIRLDPKLAVFVVKGTPVNNVYADLT